ncbi:MAG: glucose-1-phosphate adenylyltransferase subunit GlgD [Clostridia bacterium]|nr:glucose-1-phosphate adenylyltransferase subunit GlgD [Clostridia bacterium]
MTAAGLIFSNIHDRSIPEMTQRRTMASIPFGCRYRMIDFPLSNMVHSDITTVGVITHYNYQSLLDHIGTGKDWDLARRSGGIKILPPYVTAYENSAAGKLYENRLEALMGSVNFINRVSADYLVLSDCDVLLNIDLRAVIDDHIASGAYMTLVTKHLSPADYQFDQRVNVVGIGADNRITEVAKFKPQDDAVDICTNIIVIKRTDLQTLIGDAMAHGYKDFYHDIIGKNLEKRNIRAYRYEGWYAYVSSLESYFAISMQLLDSEVRKNLFSADGRNIYTKTRNSAPTHYSQNANVVNSLVADGCVIEGTVENSILFRGVHVGRGTVVKNCILLQDTYVGANADLHCVITDKNVVIKDERRLSGHATMPFFIGKGQSV